MSKTPETQKPAAKKTDDDEEDEDTDDEEEGPTLRKQFLLFVKFKDEQNPGTHIMLSQSDFWMKHAGVIKGRKLTTTDTGICYFRFKKYKLTYNEYLEFLQNLADYKNVPVDEIIEKLINCGPPSVEGKVTRDLVSQGWKCVELCYPHRETTPTKRALALMFSSSDNPNKSLRSISELKRKKKY